MDRIAVTAKFYEVISYISLARHDGAACIQFKSFRLKKIQEKAVRMVQTRKHDL